VNQAPVAAAAGASGVGGGGEGNSRTILYEVATNGHIYSYEDNGVEFPLDGGFTSFPAQTVCCDRGDGSFYYLFFWNDGIAAGYYFGTIDSVGNITNYGHNLDDVAVTGYGIKSMYLEPDGNLIIADGKEKAIFTNIIRIVPNTENNSAVATLVNNVGLIGGTDLLQGLFTYNGEVWGVVYNYLVSYREIGRYDINLPGFTVGREKNGMVLYRDGQICQNGTDPNDWTLISVTQGGDGRVYMSAFYPDPVTHGYEWGIFEIADGATGLQYAYWLKAGYPNGQNVTSLFNGYASTYVAPPEPDYGTLVLRWDPVGSNNSNTPLSVTTVAVGFQASSLSLVGMTGSTNTDVWPVPADADVSINTSKYLEFSVTAPAGTRFNALNYTKRSYNNVTCSYGAVRSSLDGYASNISQVRINQSANTQTSSFYLGNMPLVSGSITFRIYFWGAYSPDWMDLVSTAADPAGTGLSIYTK
jgi:hypothetical protein